MQQPIYNLCSTWVFYSIATYLEIPTLRDEFHKRMQTIAADQVSVEDCKTIFNTTTTKRYLRTIVTRSVTNAMFKKRLKDKGQHAMFRSECYEYDKAVNQILTPMVEARRKAWALEAKKEEQAAMEKT